MPVFSRAFRRLTRHFASGLVNNDLLSPGDDLHATFAGALGGLVVLSATAALMLLGKYNSVTMTQGGIFKPAPLRPLSEKLLMALDDKVLLLGGVMLVMALLTVLFWDAVVADERDHGVLGPLPVRPSVVLAAKWTAAAGAASVVALALNLLPSVFFPIVVFAKSPVGGATVGRWMLAHVTAGLVASLWVFLTLTALRALLGVALPSALARRAVPAVQFLLVLTLLSLLLALPLLADDVRPALDSRARWLWLAPHAWFLGLEEVMIGSRNVVYHELARSGALALLASVILTAAVQLLVLRRVVRCHTSGAASRRTAATVLSRLLGWFARRVATDSRARASFLFTAHTLLRSPRHRLYVGGALGTGLAIAGATLGAAYRGVALGRSALDLTTMGLAAQLNLVFFLVVGFRLAANIPVDVDAAWVFRFHAAPVKERYLAGSRAAIFVLAVLPVLLVLAPLHAWAWGVYAALVHFAFGVVAALVLLEIAFDRYDRVPFVSAFTPGRALLSLRLPAYVLGYAAFAYVVPAAERLLIERPGMFYTWVAFFVLAVVRLLGAQSARLRRDGMPTFDVDTTEIQQLGLSGTRLSSTLALSGDRESSRGMDNTAGTALLGSWATSRSGWREAVPSSRDVWAALRRTPQSLLECGHEVHLALRRLRANPGFAFFSVLTLALGIGATTAIYSVISSTVLKPLPVPHLEQLVNLYHHSPYLVGSRALISMSQPDYEDFRAAQTVFSDVAAHWPFAQVLVADGLGERVNGEAVSGSYFSTLQVGPVLGRLLQPADDRPGAPRVVVLGHRLWQRRFGGRPDVIGSRLTLAGEPFEVVGVAPPTFHGVELPNLVPTTAWVPLAQAPVFGIENAADREFRWLLAIGRLAPGRTTAQAEDEVWRISKHLDEKYPIGRDLPPALRSPVDLHRSWVSVPASKRMLTERADPVMLRLVRLTMTAVGLVLLVACTNLANLMLARGATRRREFAVRRALGATRWQVVREQLVESALVAIAGSVVALGLAKGLMVYGLTRTVRIGTGISLDLAPSLSLPVVAVACGATLLALVVFGLLPALRLTASELRSVGGGSEAASPPWRGRRILIAAQVTVSVALVVVAALAVRQMQATADQQVGRSVTRLALARFDFAAQKWSEARARPALAQMLDAVERQPGIETAAVVSGLLAGPFGAAGTTLATPDRPFDEPRYHGRAVTLVAATPSALETLGVNLLAGRFFDESDSATSGAVVVLSERAARSLFGTSNVLGRDVLRRTPAVADRGELQTESMQVVGVARDTDDATAARHPHGFAFRPFSQHYESSVTLVARASDSSHRALAVLNSVVRRLQPDLGVIQSGDGLRLMGVESLALQVMGLVAGSLGLLAMTLAMAGLYGVLSYLVVHRTREIGIRRVLGASHRSVMGLVVTDGAAPVVWGVIAGVGLGDLIGIGLQPAFRTELPRLDPWLLAALPIPFLLAALAACYVPARRAAAVEPTEALRP